MGSKAASWDTLSRDGKAASGRLQSEAGKAASRGTLPDDGKAESFPHTLAGWPPASFRALHGGAGFAATAAALPSCAEVSGTPRIAFLRSQHAQHLKDI